MDVASVAANGVFQAQTAFDQAANQLAQVSQKVDSVDLSGAAVALIRGKNDFSANVDVEKVADSLDKTAIDLVG